MAARTWFGRALLIAVVSATACTPAAAQEGVVQPGVAAKAVASEPKRLIAAILGVADVMFIRINPQTTASGADALEQLLSSGLTIKDGQGRLVPQLAENVPSLENGLWKLFPDGRMETTWTIRQGAVWHDGQPFTAHDLVFTAQVAQDRDLAIFQHVAFESIASLEAVDSRTFTLKWSAPFIDADSMFSRDLALPMPRHLLESPLLTNRDGFRDLPFWSEDFIGSGPYRERAFARGSSVSLSANDSYVLGRPKIDEIEVRFIPDQNALIANVLAGAVEATLGRGISTELALQVRDQWREGRVVFGPSGNWLTVFPQFLDPDPPIVGDVRFRRALMHAIDRDQMAESLQYGLAPALHGFLNPEDRMYPAIASRIVRYDFDPRAATTLLSELGYAAGGDGALRDSGGRKLGVQIRGFPTDSQQKAMFAVADFWQRLGLDVEPVVISEQRQRDSEYLATFPAFVVTRAPNDIARLRTYHSNQAPVPTTNFRGSNRSRYQNAEFDGLVERLFVTIPLTQRTAILGDIIHLMTDRLIAMGLTADTTVFLIGNRLENVGAAFSSANQTWNAHEWNLT
ncbi:MAG: hypothetical protein HW416_958 [Chloroflexi bacterium]|nr:hypothetical protein [Chloroflexota bacterium]